VSGPLKKIKSVLFKRKKTPHENRFSCGPSFGESLLQRALAQIFFLIWTAFPGNAAL
jgi:hypothetical protein